MAAEVLKHDLQMEQLQLVQGYVKTTSVPDHWNNTIPLHKRKDNKSECKCTGGLEGGWRNFDWKWTSGGSEQHLEWSF